MEDNDNMQVIARRVVRDAGTLIIFEGVAQDDENLEVTFAADHRMAHPIREALAIGEEDVVCDVADFLILRTEQIQ